jgi:hypothetical protein
MGNGKCEGKRYGAKDAKERGEEQATAKAEAGLSLCSG